MSRNEADTRAELIDPRLRAAGWTGSLVTRKHSYIRDRVYTTNTQIMIIRPNERSLGKWLFYFLYSRCGQTQILAGEEGIAFADKRVHTHLYPREMKTVPIPLPTSPKQRCIVEYLDDVQAQVKDLKRIQVESAAELERLEGAILARAFRGVVTLFPPNHHGQPVISSPIGGHAMQLNKRNVVIIKPKGPFLERVNSDPSLSPPVPIDYLRQDCTAILVPDLYGLEDVLEYVESFKPVLFEMELEARNLDSATWPAERTNQVFDTWFELEVHSMVWDSVDMPIEKEKL